VDFNIQYFEKICLILKINIEFELSEKHITPGEFSGNDLRDHFSPNKKNSIKPYLQVFADRSDFVPDLSILDVLFNLGTQTNVYLDRSDLIL
jgi:hypothetical protein